MTGLKHRLPVRLRHHWKVVAACCAFFAVLAGLFGTARVRPFVTSDERSEVDVVTEDIAGTVDIFDLSKPHRIVLSYAGDDYDRMLDQYFKDGAKDYLEADLTIDGTSVHSVGIRLKGNSTLGSLTRNGQRAPRSGAVDRGAGNAPPRQGGQAPGGQAPGGQAPGGEAPGGRAPGGVMRAGPGMTQLSVDAPEALPWLISFDEYVEGRRYQGNAEIAVRPAGASTTAINEALALSLVAESAEPTQRFAYSSFTVNDRPATTRLLVQHPDEAYAESLDGAGVLYKSRASSQFTDQGDDPTAYQDDFDQINLKGSQDLQPVMDLIRWVGRSSDEEFAAGLADRVDVPSFARYVALQNLLLNFDDMSGPGRNYYLYYNLDSAKFTVVTWDLNLALSGDAAQGPHDTGRMGGPGMGQRPGGAQPVPGGAQQAPGGQQGPGGGFMQGHTLKERFLNIPEFTQVYEDAYRDLYRKLFAGGAGLRALDRLTTAARAAGGGATIDAETANLRTLIENRTKSLATNEVITK